jgi:hypothetical protein
MFEEYLQDASELFKLGENALVQLDERTAKRFFRAGIFYTASAMEAFVNFLADGFAIAERLSSHERAFLNDKQFVVNPSTANVVEKIRYYGVEDKLKFLIHKFVPELDLGTSENWKNFLEFKGFRDQLVHPKQVEDEIQVSEYKNKLHRGMSGIINIMSTISEGIFGRPLRKQILDLIPD